MEAGRQIGRDAIEPREGKASTRSSVQDGGDGVERLGSQVDPSGDEVERPTGEQPDPGHAAGTAG
jgi:hypothetical protein